MDYTSTAGRLPRKSGSIASIIAAPVSFLRNNKKFVIILAAAVFAFYWFEVRPIRINTACSMDAGFNARTLLASKANITTDPARKAAYQDLMEKNMYLRSDYESYYSKCLRSYGIYVD